ncbi:MAG TPA: lipopolysaccharide heptosyltransferase I [Edaphobacter sp.]|nr:lipopolysaccharide heptosyltransferase I [Edaphobacter sp.]
MASRDKSTTSLGEKSRVLIVRIGAMGDVIHALPAAAALRHARPESTIGWVIEPRWSPLLRAICRSTAKPVVDQIFLAETRRWKQKPFSVETLGDITGLRRRLRENPFDVCVDMQGSIRSAVIGRMAGAGEFCGPAEPREAPAGWLYQRKIRVHEKHVVEQGCELLSEGLGLRLPPAEFDLPVDSTAERICDAALSGFAISNDRYALICPTAGWGAKQWPAERFGAVARELSRRGIPSVINAAGPSDHVAEKVVEFSQGCATSIAGDIPQLIELTRRSSVVIAGDTGPLHLAAAMRRPVVALFGPTDPARNGPYGTAARVLRHGADRRDHRRLAEPEAGLLEITVDEVVRAAEEILQGTPG